MQQSCVGLLLVLIAGCRSPEATPTPLAPGSTVPVATQPTNLLESETPETSATEAVVLEETPLIGVPAVCPQGGGDPPVIGQHSFETGVFEHFEAQFTHYLDQVGSAEGLAEILEGLTLEDRSSTTWLSTSNVFTADVTGDDVPEVLIDLVFYVGGQYGDGAIYIFVCGDNEYVTLDRFWIGGQAFSGGPEAGIRAIEDLSGDGVPEIVTSSIEMIGTAANFHRSFRIMGWDGEAFSDLPHTDQGGLGTVTVENGDGEILDTDGDGLPELVLHSRVGGHPDTSVLERPRTEIWGWNGLLMARHCSRADTAPVYRIQAIIDGDDATLCGDYDAALAFYQQAILDEELLPWTSRLDPSPEAIADALVLDPIERANLSAYGQYRILLLRAAQGILPEARIVYDSLQDQFPEGSDGHAYAVMAAAFWDAFMEEDDVRSGCLAAIDYAAEHPSEILTPLGRDVYGFGVRALLPSDVCPQNALIIES